MTELAETTPRKGRGLRPTTVLVALVVAVNAWLVRSEALATHQLNDASFHLAYLQWAADRLAAGHLPLDGLFTPLGLGFPIFHHYQVLPYLVMAPVALAFGAGNVLAWTTFGLLALWPVCIYASARLFGLARWPAATAAAVAPFLVSVAGYGYETGSYVWRGYGMWTQLWGMWLLPLALALTWRAVVRGRSLLLAALVTGVTIASHLLTGYLALLALGLWVVVNPKPLRRHLWRAAAVGAGGLAVTAWLLVPALLDQRWTRMGLPPGTFWTDSYGARKVLGWLATGELFDHGRLPVITALAGVGLVVALRRWRSDPASRAVVAFFAMSLVLYCGRPTFGMILDRLPGQQSLFLHRMIIGVHLGGIWLAGIGLAWLGQAAFTSTHRVVAARKGREPLHPPALARPTAWLGVVAVAALLVPAWRDASAYGDEGAAWAEQQRQADAGQDSQDFAGLVAKATARGDGRIYAGLLTNWGREYRIGYVPAVVELLNRGADGLGFTGRVPALTEPSEARFDDTSAADYELFGVRYAIEPAERAGPPGAVLVATAGRHRLWEVPTVGYVRVIDTTTAIASSRQQIDAAVGEVLRSGLALQGKYPLLALDGRATSAPSSPPGQSAGGPAGSVEALQLNLVDGRLRATVGATRAAAVLVKMSYHGRWQATVDGVSVPPQVVAPGLLAVPVAAGRHDVVAWYAPVPGPTYGALALMALAMLALLAWYDRRSRARTVPRSTARLGDGRGGDRQPVDQPLVVDGDRVGLVVAGASVVDADAVGGAAVGAGAAVVGGGAAGTRAASVGSSFTA